MKKIYSLLFATVISWPGYAQLTLQSSDLPVPGLVFTMGTDDNYSAPIPAGGASQSWNYSTLNNVDEDTVGFMAAAGTPFAAMVPTANLASQSPSTGNWSYFTSSSTGFYQNGSSDPSITGGFAELDPPQLFVPTPFTYLNSTSSDSRMEVFASIYDSTLQQTINVKLVHAVHTTIIADGWGSLILPSGTHNNTLRTAITENVKDSVFIDLFGLGVYTFFLEDTSHHESYRWFGPGPASLLLEIEMDSLGTTATRSEYLVNYILLGTHEPTVSRNELLLYPNPASDRITVRCENSLQPTTVQVFDATGRMVLSAVSTQLNHLELPVGHLSNGLYHVRMQTHQGAVQTGRFTVSH